MNMNANAKMNTKKNMQDPHTGHNATGRKVTGVSSPSWPLTSYLLHAGLFQVMADPVMLVTLGQSGTP